MNWQKLNEVDTYTNLWRKITGRSGKHKKTEDTPDEETMKEEMEQQYTAPADNEQTANEPTSQAAPKEQPTAGDADVVDLRDLMADIRKKWKWFAIVLPIVFVLSAVIILDEPRYYATDTTMAPELDNSLPQGGTLSSIAESFGFDLSNVQSTDAISPVLYPDLMDDNAFDFDIFNIQITTADGKLHTTYFDYLKNHQQKSTLSEFGDWLRHQAMKLFKPHDVKVEGASKEFNPYIVDKMDDALLMKLRDNIAIDVDKKTGLINIAVEDQYPYVCKIMADSVRARLQDFIIEYRTSKTRRDVEYYQKLADDARATYEKTRHEYAQISDANFDLILETEKSKIEDLENTMQMQYNTYTAMCTQLDAARAKLRQYTPVYTMVKGAAVPVLPAGPKRMLFILAMLILATFVISFFAIRKDIMGRVKRDKPAK